jgi:hypothetical protein
MGTAGPTSDRVIISLKYIVGIIVVRSMALQGTPRRIGRREWLQAVVAAAAGLAGCSTVEGGTDTFV